LQLTVIIEEPYDPWIAPLKDTVAVFLLDAIEADAVT
jgi:hypothetical protein